MLRKIWSIVLALAMLFALTGCNMLMDLADIVLGDKEEEPSNELLLPEGEYYYFGEGFEEGDGSIRIEIETDEEGNLIGKLEQIDPDEAVENDEPLINKEPAKNEEPSKNNAATNQRSIISHIGLTKSAIEQLYGRDLTVDEYGALSYKDGRIPLRFYFTGSSKPKDFDGTETVSCVAVKGGEYPICSFLTGNETGAEVAAKGGYYCGSQGSLWLANGSEIFVLYDGQNMNGAELVCMHADDEGVLCNFNYYWKNGSDCDKKAADLIIVG